MLSFLISLVQCFMHDVRVTLIPLMGSQELKVFNQFYYNEKKVETHSLSLVAYILSFDLKLCYFEMF